MNRWGAQQIGQLTEKEFLVAGAALYWGEGGKTTSEIYVANTDPDVIQSSSPGCATSSTSTGPSGGVGCTSTRDSISPQLSGSGPRSAAFQ
jgi:hypothetical protein